MKTFTLLAVAIGVFAALPVTAQTVVKTTTVASRGTVAEYDPGNRFVMTETSGPVTYHYGPSVVYRTSSGVVIPEAEYRTRIIAGAPVRVHYVTEGDRRVIQRVVLRDRGDKDDDDDDDN
ncbi:hypothetical protein AYO49_01825 [Verrucomicrobiaceae bacterium SCGC AG-212-N21]|nr:hypothetical protein AYO49_01825 [Verrucomicrobiaceae bacterium SCGC AG-212-N21]